VSECNAFLEPANMHVSSSTPKAARSLANVQRRLLQCHVPDFDNIECSVMYRPAEIVGGDFYDVLRLPTGELGIAIGDVSGKGLEAALMMASVQATLRAEVGHAADIGTALARVNNLFHEASLEHCYATLFYAVLDPSTGVMKYVNAGHFPPMLLVQRERAAEWLDRGGPPVGILPACTYDIGSITLHPEDILVAYTDGVIETRNLSGQQFGVNRLVGIVRASEDRTPGALSADITTAVEAFSGGAAQHDDMALVILRIR
jgi:phosphoserine phosphatase RsbU/P